MDAPPTNPTGHPLVKPALNALGFLSAGLIGLVVGVQPRLDDQGRRLDAVEVEIRARGRQIDRLEQKVDQVLDRLTEKQRR